MRFAVLSDIHSNLEALTSVLGKCKLEKVDGYLIPGDIVGYNASPGECIKAVMLLNPFCLVYGNHDWYAAHDKASLKSFNKIAGAACQWTRRHLPPEDKKWLVSGKAVFISSQHDFTVVHSSLDSPESWGYIANEMDAMCNFMNQTTGICFCGHSHVPVFYMRKKNSRFIGKIEDWENIPASTDEIKIWLNKKDQYLVNPGSIGQPRNGDPRASFCIYDSIEFSVKRVCVEYDIQSAKEKIIAAGLPELLAMRLGMGR